MSAGQAMLARRIGLGSMIGAGVFASFAPASCAAMALTFASYAVPTDDWLRRLVAVLAVLALAGLNLGGITARRS